MALLEAHRQEISLAVTDLIMPEAGGAALYEATTDWEPRPAFLITSGYSLHRGDLAQAVDSFEALRRKAPERETAVGALGFAFTGRR